MNSNTTTTASAPVASHTPKWDEFRAGVTACLRSWSALRAAVQGQWGGVESLAKAEFLRTTIFGYFETAAFQQPTVTQDELEDHLAIYVEEEFAVQLEDESERQVANVIWQLYHTCLVQGDATYASQVVQSALQADAQAPSFPVQVQEQAMEDDDDDDDEAMDTAMDPTKPVVAVAAAAAAPLPQQPTTALPSAADYASQYLFGEPLGSTPHHSHAAAPVRQLGEAAPAPEPAVDLDEDGFAPVVKRKGRR